MAHEYPFLAEVNSGAAGFVMGQATVVGGLVLGVYKCWRISRRPTTSAKCAYSLLTLLGGVLVSALSSVLNHWTEVPGGATATMTSLAGILILFSLVPAVLGLQEFYRFRDRYTQGRNQAIATIVIVAVCLAMAISPGFNSRSRESSARYRYGQQLTTLPTEVFEEFNYRFKPPGHPWTSMDVSRLNRAAQLAYLRSGPEVFFMIIGERSGDLDRTSEDLASFAEAKMRSVASSTQVRSRRPHELGPLKGLLVSSDARLRSDDLTYCSWVCATNGWAYQLIAWGRKEHQSAVEREFLNLSRGFGLIDLDRRPSGGGKEPRLDFVSTNFQVRVRWAGSDWREWPGFEKEMPGALFGAQHKSDAALAVVAVSLAGFEPHAEAIENALPRILIQGLDAARMVNRRAIRERELTGIRFETTQRLSNGKDYTYHLKVLHGGGLAWLVGAWAESSHPKRDAMIADAFGRIDLAGSTSGPPEPAQMNDTERRTHRMALNEIGTFYYQAQQHEIAARYYKACLAVPGAPTNSVYLNNFMQACFSAGRYREALDELELHPEQLGAQRALQADRAFLQARLGMTEAALTNYSQLFTAGFRDEPHFREYVVLLARVRGSDAALAELNRFVQLQDSVDLRLLQSGLLKNQRKFDEAIPLLEQQRQKNPFHAGIASALADAYLQAGRPTDALALSKELIGQQGKSAQAWFLKGRAEFGLKWYREAKESFEQAALEAPSDADIKNFLDHVSGMLGEGANSTIKQSISPVEIPSSLLQAPAPIPAGYAREFGACYVRRLTAVSFERGKELKTTDLTRIQTFNTEGVSAFSTFQVPFDAAAEELFINHLEVRNAAGNLVSTGKVADCYVLDDRLSASANSRKTLNIPVSGLQAGYSVELMVTRRELGRAAEFTFLAQTFSRAYPVRESVLFVRGDTGAVRFASSPALPPERLPEGLCWRIQEPPVFKMEALQPPITEFLPTVWVSDASVQWSSVVTNYLGQIRDRLELSAGRRELATQITAAATNAAQKYAAIAAYVQTNLTYKAIEFGRRARFPQSPADVLRNRYGDCKDHAVLARDLLSAVGLPATLALVHAGGEVRQDLPSLDQFNHMIVHLKLADGDRFLDCTDKANDLAGSRHAGLNGLDALLLDSREPKFIHIPEAPMSLNSVRCERVITPTNQLEVLVRETLTFQGALAGELRRSLRGLPLSARRSYFASQLASLSADLGELDVTLENLSAPVVIRMTYVIRGQWQRTGSEIVGSLPGWLERSYFNTELSSRRLAPLRITLPLTLETDCTVTVPSGYRPKPISPATHQSKGKFVSCDWSSRTHETGWQVRWTSTLPSGRFPAADYPEYAQALKEAATLLNPGLVCEPVPR